MIVDLLSPAGLVVLLPLLAAAVLATVPQWTFAPWINLAAAAATFALACRLPWQLGAWALLLVDPPAAHMAVLASFVGMTTAWYMAAEANAGRMRLQHLLFQLLLAFTLLALLCNNLGVVWICVEAATIAAVAAVGMPLTPASVAAGWRYLVLGGAGLGLALFGTVVFYLAARPALGAGMDALDWSRLAQAGAGFDAGLLNLAFVLLVLGYGTLAGLAPLHGWLPDATEAGPTAISALFSGAAQLAPLLVILRLRGLLVAHAEALAPGPLLLVLGLASLLFAAFSLWRERELKRFLAVSGIGQTGIVVFAFGLGGTAALFAGLLLLTLHTLTRAALFQCAGYAGGRVTLAAAVGAMAGLPPLGVFAGWFLIVAATVGQSPWLALPLGAGLVVFAWALVAKLVALWSGASTPNHGPVPATLALAPAWLHLAVTAVLGFAMPASLVAWFTLVAGSLR